MKQLLLLLLLASSFVIKGQETMPSYHTVLKQYFQQYNHIPQEPADGLNFAKRKTGWFAQVVDRLTEEVKKEQLFWSSEQGWQPLKEFSSALPEVEQEERIIQFLTGRASQYLFYGYARSPYYGYGGWDEDMISDFGHLPFASLPDTVLENLGRAYSAYATRFSWLQYGGAEKEIDTLKRKLLPLERPSVQRADSIADNIRKAISCFAALKERKPNYQTLVGNIGMKHFNEQIFGYDQMLMAGYQEKAQEFLQGIEQNVTVISLAKNYLNNCPPNAILFSFGDIDTYTLWYVQQTLNYRKDVTVINQSLLGLPAYIQMLSRTKQVGFAVKPETYGDPLFVYSLFSENNREKASHLLLSSFLQHLYNRKNHQANNPASYFVKEISQPVDLTKFTTSANIEGLGASIEFQLGDYITIDQVMMLDIIQTNFQKRPICFTYSWEPCRDYLLQLGTVHQLLPLNTKMVEKNKKTSISQLENFLSNKFQIITSSDFSTGIAPDLNYDGTNYSLIGQMVEWYHSKNNPVKATAWLSKLKLAYKNDYAPSTYGYLGYLYYLNGDAAKARQIFEENAELIYQLYKHPSPFYSIFSKDAAKLAIEKLQTELAHMKQESPVIEKFAALINQ